MKKRETGFLVKIIIFAFAAFAVVTILQLQLKYNAYKAEVEALREEVEDLEDKKEELENQQAGLNDEDHIVDVAKEKLNLRLPEEIIFYNDLYN